MRNLFKLLLGEDFNLPLLNDAYEIAADEFIEIGMDPSDLTYFVEYPSGLAKEFDSVQDLHRELIKFIPNEERREDVIRYATNWRRTVFFPALGSQFIRFPDGRINFGGAGNSRLSLPPQLMQLHIKYNTGGSE
jgi:hypothetical protein